MRNFDSNIENVLFLNYNFVFTIMINNIVKELWEFSFWKLAGGGGVNTHSRFNKVHVQWYYAHVWFFPIN